MPRKSIWTEGQDTQIRRLRTEGASWEIIAAALGLARLHIIERARTIGAEHPPAIAITEDSERPPLPAGHGISWEAITRGTSLDGVPFRTPGTVR